MVRNQRLKWRKSLSCQVKEALITMKFSKGNIQNIFLCQIFLKDLTFKNFSKYIVIAVVCFTVGCFQRLQTSSSNE